jgi:DNA-binding FadR family transcriptional regulator
MLDALYARLRRCGDLPSVRELHDLQGIARASLRAAFSLLAARCSHENQRGMR